MWDLHVNADLGPPGQLYEYTYDMRPTVYAHSIITLVQNNHDKL